MTVESATYINDFNISYPASGDVKSEGDDHLRNLKIALKNTFPGMAGAFARTQSKGTNYTVVANDNTTLITATAALTLNLTAAATLGNKHWFAVDAQGGAVTIDPNSTEQVNGATTLVIPQGYQAFVWCTGSAFIAAVLSRAVPAVPQLALGRLTLASGVPVSIVDQTAKTTLYYTPYVGNQIALYTGSQWVLRTFSELSIAVPASTSQMYDVFIYDNAGTPALELLVWTDDITRATALVRQDGVLVKSGATTRRYVGSFRTTGTSGQTEDSDLRRFVWNMDNRVLRKLKKVDANTNWTYSTTAWRIFNNDATNKVEIVIGLTEDIVEAQANALAGNSTSTTQVVSLGVGCDSTTAPGGPAYTIQEAIINYARSLPLAVYSGYPGIGYHYFAPLEYGSGADTQTWWSGSQSGIRARVFN